MAKVNPEPIAIAISAILIFSTFGYALYAKLNTKVETLEIRVFYYEYREGRDITVVYPYGMDYVFFIGKHEFEIGEYYRIKCKFLGGRRREIISLEKI